MIEKVVKDLIFAGQSNFIHLPQYASPCTCLVLHGWEWLGVAAGPDS